ncbi:MAG: hypothetical protein AAGN64_07540 [Bacteroidota bacterium]
MSAWLLTWNPKYCDVADTASRVERDSEVVSDWSTNSFRIEAGDRLFLMRQGVEPRGIVAIGTALGIPHLDHEDGRYYVPLVWEQFWPQRPILPLALLKEEYPDQCWTPRASGTRIKSDRFLQLYAV